MSSTFAKYDTRLSQRRTPLLFLPHGKTLTISGLLRCESPQMLDIPPVLGQNYAALRPLLMGRHKNWKSITVECIPVMNKWVNTIELCTFRAQGGSSHFLTAAVYARNINTQAESGLSRLICSWAGQYSTVLHSAESVKTGDVVARPPGAGKYILHRCCRFHRPPQKTKRNPSYSGVSAKVTTVPEGSKAP